MKRFGSFTLDTTNECLWRDGNRITLPPRPFSVLRYLVEHPGRLVTHDELLDALWPETYVQPQVLRTYMLDLRKLLGDDPRSPRYIQSLPKRGYCFVAPVCDAAHPQSSPSARASALQELAGRDRELAELREHLQEAAAGARQVIVVSGESGVGKTALADFFRKQVEQDQAAVIALGQCIQGFAGKHNYYPVSDALRQICGSPEAPAACAFLGRCAGSGDENGRPSSLLPGDVCAAIEQIPGSKPLLLILEDLQWADEFTLDVVSALARRHGPARLMILITLTAQTAAASHTPALLHDLRIRRLCREIALPRLRRAEVADLVRMRLQQPTLPDGLPEFVHQHSEGNPRFALVLLDHLIAERILARAAGDNPGWELRASLDQADAATPGDIARMIEIEIESLTPHEQQIVEAASLAPVAFASWLVAAALGEDVAAIEDACDDLARRLSFVKRAGEDELPDGTRSGFYVFAHALYREVLYRRQSPARCRLRHIRIAERLRRMFPGQEELIAHEAAAHYQAADDWLNAIAMLQTAAGRALELRAYGDAADLHQRIACLREHLPLADLQAISMNDRGQTDLASSFDSAPPIDSATAKA